MTDEEFRASMCKHMAEQTAFLRDISQSVWALKVVANALFWVGGVIVGGVNAYDFIRTHMK